MSVLKDRLRSIRCTWNPAEHRTRAKLGLMTVSASRGKVRREGGERRREEEEKSLQHVCHASVCHSPLRFPGDMNEVNEWWTRPTKTPLFYWGRAVHSRGWVRRQHQQQQQQQRHRRPLLLFLIHTYVCSHTDTHIRPKYYGQHTIRDTSREFLRTGLPNKAQRQRGVNSTGAEKNKILA